ncbi:hypothetical protein [Pseudodesulfovibrio sp. zrk46]|uniref:hypothetical protein n=1 Tax=Pseudodesulfovibrio sp. zrk46 TaxID=2725288 RepID=UPI001448E87C|nr:hypothetical protein [Pseudodesulfovibrio sp. zrk46]QJB55970.1 hypothetical protein HFN16_05895 [Pseudodesulfovibrio sp. zrk46]
MRTILFILMLLVTLTACGGKEDVSTDPAGETANAEQTANAEEGEAAPATEEKSVMDYLPPDPIGEVHMSDGRVLELSGVKPIGGHYYLYITGKLNGRSSTVLSFTRTEDLQYWKGISFNGPHSFVILTNQDKQLVFEDARIYIGSDSPDTFTFTTLDSTGFGTEAITVNKSDVKVIAFTPPKED